MSFLTAFSWFLILVPTNVCQAESTARPDGNMGKAPVQGAPSLQLLQGPIDSVKKIFKIANAENQFVEVKLEVENSGGEPVNRDVRITVSIRCKTGGSKAFQTVFKYDESCAFSELSYDSVANNLIVTHEVARLVTEPGPDRGRLRCERKEPILIALKCPPAKGA